MLLTYQTEANHLLICLNIQQGRMVVTNFYKIITIRSITFNIRTEINININMFTSLGNHNHLNPLEGQLMLGKAHQAIASNISMRSRDENSASGNRWKKLMWEQCSMKLFQLADIFWIICRFSVRSNTHV